MDKSSESSKWQICGVYFLLLEGKCVYIGQSIDIWDRVKDHKRQCILFDKVKIFRCAECDLRKYERAYIKKYRPEFNIVHNRDIKSRYKKKVYERPAYYKHARMRLRKLTERSVMGFGRYLYSPVSSIAPYDIANIYFTCSHINFFDDVLDRAKVSSEWRIEKPGIVPAEVYIKFCEAVFPKEHANKQRKHEIRQHIQSTKRLQAMDRLSGGRSRLMQKNRRNG